jgi:hypothetical protein
VWERTVDVLFTVHFQEKHGKLSRVYRAMLTTAHGKLLCGGSRWACRYGAVAAVAARWVQVGPQGFTARYMGAHGKWSCFTVRSLVTVRLPGLLPCFPFTVRRLTQLMFFTVHGRTENILGTVKSNFPVVTSLCIKGKSFFDQEAIVCSHVLGNSIKIEPTWASLLV